jgi:hypothetical protein
MSPSKLPSRCMIQCALQWRPIRARLWSIWTEMQNILTLGKGLGGGVPLAAMLATEAVSCFAHGDQGAHSTATRLCVLRVSPSSTRCHGPVFLAASQRKEMRSLPCWQACETL